MEAAVGLNRNRQTKTNTHLKICLGTRPFFPSEFLANHQPSAFLSSMRRISPFFDFEKGEKKQGDTFNTQGHKENVYVMHLDRDSIYLVYV